MRLVPDDPRVTAIGVVVTADGTVAVRGDAVFTVRAGRLECLDGRVAASVDPTGRVVFPGGRGRFDTDDALHVNDWWTGVDRRGVPVLVTPRERGPLAAHWESFDPRGRRLAALLLASITTGMRGYCSR